MQKFLRSLIVGLALCLLGAIPATASAGILYSGASEVAVGTQIAGTGVETSPKFYSGSSAYVECTGASLTGKVAANRAENAEIGLENMAFSGSNKEGKCSFSGGAIAVSIDIPSCLQYSKALEVGQEWKIRGEACLTSASLAKLTMNSSWGQCRYTENSEKPLVFGGNKASEPLILKQPTVGAAFSKKEGGILCPASLTLKELRLKLETGSGQGLRVTS